MAGIPSASQSAAAIVDVMHSVVQGNLPRGAQVGIVVSPPPSRVVKMNNIEITAKDVYCSRYLLPGYTRHMVGQTSDRGGAALGMWPMRATTIPLITMRHGRIR